MEIIGSHNNFQTCLIDEELEIIVTGTTATTSDSVPDDARLLSAQYRVTEFGDTGTVATMDIGYTANGAEMWDDTPCTAVDDKDSQFQANWNTPGEIKNGASTIDVTLNAAVAGASVKVRLICIYEQLIDLT